MGFHINNQSDQHPLFKIMKINIKFEGLHSTLGLMGSLGMGSGPKGLLWGFHIYI